MSVSTALFKGASVLTPSGPKVVVGLSPLAVTLRGVDQRMEEVDWWEIEGARQIFDGRVDAVTYSVSAEWEGLSSGAQEQALDRQEIVLEILTGYSKGHRVLARQGEPAWPFDPRDNHTLQFKIEKMVERLQREYVVDRQRRRNAENLGRSRIGPASVKTLKNWVSAYKDEANGGLFGLVDGRSRRKYRAFESLDPEVRRMAEEQVDTLDGSRSDLNRLIVNKSVEPV